MFFAGGFRWLCIDCFLHCASPCVVVMMGMKLLHCRDCSTKWSWIFDWCLHAGYSLDTSTSIQSNPHDRNVRWRMAWDKVFGRCFKPGAPEGDISWAFNNMFFSRKSWLTTSFFVSTFTIHNIFFKVCIIYIYMSNMYTCASVFAGNLNQHPHDVATMAFLLAFFGHVGRSADGHLRRKMRETFLQKYTTEN